MAWAKNGTPDTLTSSGDTLTISDLTAYKFNQFLHYTIASSTIRDVLTTDNNTATDYAIRRSQNGGADLAQTSQANIKYSQSGETTPFFGITYVINITGEEKLVIAHLVNQDTAGAGTAPQREEIIGKVDTTTNSGQFTRIDMTNDQAGSYDTDSNLSAIGTD